MTEQELAAIQARAEAATPGPWFHDRVRSQVASLGPTGRLIAKVSQWGKFNTWKTTAQDDLNAQFIAHAREDIPALLAEVERLRHRLGQYGGTP